MNKAELIAAVAEKTGLSKKDSEKAVNAAFDTIAANLDHGCRGFHYGICGRAVNKKDRLREMIGKISYAHRRSFYSIY